MNPARESLPRPLPDGVPFLSLRKDEIVVVADVRVARTFLSRLLGLMGRRPMARGQGLYFPRCRSIHTCFMRFPIDLVFLDTNYRVVGIRREVRPWSAAHGGRQACSVLEVASGWLPCSALVEGDTVEFTVRE